MELNKNQIMESKITIQNLKCGGCAHTITTKLSELQDVNKVLVDTENSIVIVNYSKPDLLDEIINKLAALGYPQEGDKNSVVSKAKSFVSCASGRMTK